MTVSDRHPAPDAVTLADVQAARARISDALENTPCTHSRTLSKITGAEVYLKFENLQFTGAYKERGALNKLLQLTEAERAAGVIAMSAGNHAQGLAYHAGRLGVPATIVMPQGTPFVKVERTADLGATVDLHGETLIDATSHARALAVEKGLTFVHPFDDPDVIAGQGTVALEMLEAQPDLDTLVVPVGGGGLISGCAVAAKAMKPEIDVVGVEPELYPSMSNATRGEDRPCEGTTIAEGIQVKQVGDYCVPLVSKYVSDVVTVSEKGMERGISLLVAVEKTVTEGAGAAGLSALLEHPERFKGRKVGLILTGGNIDARLLSSVLVRELVRERRILTLRIRMPDRPGSLLGVAKVCAESGANVLEVSHNRLAMTLSAKSAELLITIETMDGNHADRVIADLARAGFDVITGSADAG